jgi:Tol biopolymer transport system component
MLADIGWAGAHALVVTAMANGGGSDVFRIDLQGGQRLLWHDSRWLGSMSVSPDGRHVALSASVSKVNAWIAENF